MKTLIPIILCILSWHNAFTQNNSKIDSLKNVLNGSKKIDTVTFKTLSSLSSRYRNIAEYDSALRYAKQALTISQKINYKRGIASAYNILGTIYFYENNYPKALKYLDASLKIARENGLTKSLGVVYNNLGLVYHSLSNNTKAIDCYLKALKIYEELAIELEIAKVNDNICNVYRTIGRYSEALSHTFTAMKIYKRLGNEREIAVCYSNIAVIYTGQRKLDKSLFYCFKALPIYKTIGDKNGIAYAFNSIGINYDELGKLDIAITYYDSALLLNKEMEDKLGIALNLENISLIYLKRNKLGLSRKYLNEALNLALEINNPDLIKSCYGQFSKLDSASGDFKSAYSHLKLYNEMRDSISNQEKDKKITQLALQYEFDKREAEAKNEQKKKEIMQASALADAKKNRNIIVAVLMALLLFSGTVFYHYSQRKKFIFQRQVSEVEMKALRAQMNPHFIFNSLNSIYNCIQVNDNKTACSFIVKFSKLIRLILENSTYPLITLQEEITVLHLYLSLEVERLQNKFSYTIKIEEGLKPESVLIPPLIFQPYVENSVWHGMQSDLKEGWIEINFNKKGDLLYCTITDNGLGIKADVQGDKKSLGTSITEQRLEVLNQQRNTKGSVKIKNINDEDSDNTGVRVELEIPVEMA